MQKIQICSTWRAFVARPSFMTTTLVMAYSVDSLKEINQNIEMETFENVMFSRMFG